ncbi:MAG: hypothetical protein M3Y91_06880 [Actinomycetota bacterium]|nr:hypothetical protein [Actinomycetota bacterium]
MILAQWLITVNVNGQDLGVWNKMSGGDTQTKMTKERPGGMGTETLYRGLATYSDVTVTRTYQRVRDHETVRLLQQLAGNAPMNVVKQPLDENGQAFGRPIAYTGKLAMVKPGPTDSEAETLTTIELDMSVTTVA